MPPRVLIIGGGFGGLTAAQALGGAPVEVTLLDRRGWQVMMHAVGDGAVRMALDAAEAAARANPPPDRGRA